MIQIPALPAIPAIPIPQTNIFSGLGMVLGAFNKEKERLAEKARQDQYDQYRMQLLQEQIGTAPYRQFSSIAEGLDNIMRIGGQQAQETAYNLLRAKAGQLLGVDLPAYKPTQPLTLGQTPSFGLVPENLRPFAGSLPYSSKLGESLLENAMRGESKNKNYQPEYYAAADAYRQIRERYYTNNLLSPEEQDAEKTAKDIIRQYNPGGLEDLEKQAMSSVRLRTGLDAQESNATLQKELLKIRLDNEQYKKDRADEAKIDAEKKQDAARWDKAQEQANKMFITYLNPKNQTNAPKFLGIPENQRNALQKSEYDRIAKKSLQKIPLTPEETSMFNQLRRVPWGELTSEQQEQIRGDWVDKKAQEIYDKGKRGYSGYQSQPQQQEPIKSKLSPFTDQIRREIEANKSKPDVIRAGKNKIMQNPTFKALDPMQQEEILKVFKQYGF